jgi:hypothetical protein
VTNTLQKNMSEHDRLLLVDWRERVKSSLTSGPHIEAYNTSSPAGDEHSAFSAIIPAESVPKALADYQWDLTIGAGGPGIIVSGEAGQMKVEYQRCSNPIGAEPLVILRSFHSIRKEYIELSEEFRLFHNLYWDQKSNRYLKFDDAGDEEVVAEVHPKKVSIRLKDLRQFLAVRNSHAALYFSVQRFSNVNIDEIPSGEREEEFSNEFIRYSFNAVKWTHSSQFQTLSRLLGKALIAPLPIEQSGVWPYTSPRGTYQDFIIGTEATEELRLHTCDPDKLANNFGRNASSPSYLTPVFFKKDVLVKYFAQPAKYSVEDGYLRCAGLWGLRMDNHGDDYVVVFLGDLGADLPDKEQLYWKAFNVAPVGHMSEVSLRRNFLGEFTDPTRPDLRFKSAYEELCRKWPDKFGWSIFLPLSPEDKHYLQTLRIPLNDDQSEFDNQILGLCKLLVDSLNESELEKRSTTASPEAKGITKLDAFLRSSQFPASETDIKFLRDLQDLRSQGVAHRKGKGYEKTADRLGITPENLRTSFEKLLVRADAMIEKLAVHFLTD